MERAERKGYRGQLRWWYAELFRELKLSGEVVERFLDVLAERSARHEELLKAARSLGLSDYDAVVIELDAKDSAVYLAAQQRLLGEAGVKALQRYDDAMPARNIAMGFAGLATLAGCPLAPRQVAELSAIIAAETRPPTPGPFPLQVEVDWERVDARVGVVLSPEQAKLFRGVEAPGLGRGGARFMRRVNEAIMAANHAEVRAGDRGK